MPKRKLEAQVTSVLRLDDICQRVGAGEVISDDDVNYVIQLAQDNMIRTGGGISLGQVCSDLVAEINETLSYSIEGMIMDMPYPEAGFTSHYTSRRTVKAGVRPNYAPNPPLGIATRTVHATENTVRYTETHTPSLPG